MPLVRSTSAGLPRCAAPLPCAGACHARPVPGQLPRAGGRPGDADVPPAGGRDRAGAGPRGGCWAAGGWTSKAVCGAPQNVGWLSVLQGCRQADRRCMAGTAALLQSLPSVMTLRHPPAGALHRPACAACQGGGRHAEGGSTCQPEPPPAGPLPLPPLRAARQPG